MATTPDNKHGVARTKTAEADMLAPATGDARTDRVLPHLFSPQWISQNPAEAQKIAARRTEESSVSETTIRRHFEASENHDTWDVLPAITAPTLVLHGDSDEINLTANAHLLADRIPNAELCLIPGGRHEFFVEYPDETNKAIEDFLDVLG